MSNYKDSFFIKIKIINDALYFFSFFSPKYFTNFLSLKILIEIFQELKLDLSFLPNKLTIDF